MKRPSPDELLAAIHRHCMECSGQSRKEVHGCRVTGCALWPWREPVSVGIRKDGQQMAIDLWGGEADNAGARSV